MRKPIVRLLLASCSLLSAAPLLVAGEDDSKQAKPIEPAEVDLDRPVDFEKDVYPILEANCIACHNAVITESELVLEDVESILKGGARGPAVAPKDPEKSLLFRVASRAEEPHMPPLPNEMEAKVLTPKQLGMLRQWIADGAAASAAGSQSLIQWQPLPQGLNAIYSVALGPFGRLVASGCGNQIIVYDMLAGEELTRLVDPHLASLERQAAYSPPVAHRDFVHSLAFNADGTLLASGGYRVVKLWQRPQNVQQHRIEIGSPVASLAVSADGKLAALAAADHTIRLWNLIDGSAGPTLTGHSGPVTSLQFWPRVEAMHRHRQQLADAVAAEQAARAKAAQAHDKAEAAKRTAERNPQDENDKAAYEQAGKAAHDAEAALQNAQTQTQQARDALAAFEKLVADGSKLVSSSADKTVRLWNAADGSPQGAIVTPSPVNDVVFNGDATQIISAGADNMIRVWNTPQPDTEADGEPPRELGEHGGPVTSLSLVLPAGAQLVSGSEDGTMRLWNLADRKAVRSINHGGPVADVDVSPDGQTVASAGGIVARLWQLGDGKQLAETKGDVQAQRRVVQLTDAQTIAKQRVALAGNALQAAKNRLKERDESLKKAQEAKQAADKALADAKQKLKAEEDKLAAAKAELADKPDDENLKKKVAEAEKALAGQKDAVTKATEAQVSAVRGLELAEKALETSNASVELAKAEGAAADELQKHADAALAKVQQTQKEAEKPILAVQFTADGKRLLTAGEGGILQTYSAAGEPLDSLAGHHGPVAAIAPGPGNSVVSGSSDQSAIHWHINPEWKFVGQLGPSDEAPLDLGPSPLIGRVLCLDFSPDGTLLATGGGEPSRSGELMIWDVAKRAPVRTIEQAHSDTVLGLEFSRDGKYLASGAADKFVKVFEVAAGKHVRSFEGHTHHVLDVAWKADGSRIASAGADNAIKIWNFATGEQVRTISNYSKQVTSVQFVGVGENIVSSGGDRTVRFHKTSNGQNFRNFGGGTDFMYSAAATRDERIVVAGGEDGVLRVWNGTDGKNLLTIEPSNPATQ